MGSVFPEGNASIFSQREIHLYFNALKYRCISLWENRSHNALKYRCISLWENIDAFPSGITDPTMY
jgi:hypothetical protein